MRKFKIDNPLDTWYLWTIWAVAMTVFVVGVVGMIVLNPPTGTFELSAIFKVFAKLTLWGLLFGIGIGIWMFLRLCFYKQNLFLETEHMVIPHRMINQVVMLNTVKAIKVLNDFQLEVITDTANYRIKFLNPGELLRFKEAGEVKAFFAADAPANNA